LKTALAGVELKMAKATDHLSSAIGKARSLKSRRLRLNAAKWCERDSACTRPYGRSQLKFVRLNLEKR
jgi:hypothetical protein